MPDFEEYIVNYSSIDPDDGNYQVFLRRLSTYYLFSLYMCPHAFLKRHVPFCTEPPPPTQLHGRKPMLLQFNKRYRIMYRSVCQNVCFYLPLFR